MFTLSKIVFFSTYTSILTTFLKCVHHFLFYYIRDSSVKLFHIQYKSVLGYNKKDFNTIISFTVQMCDPEEKPCILSCKM